MISHDGIEMVLGQLALSAVVVAGSIFGLELIGLQGVLQARKGHRATGAPRELAHPVHLAALRRHVRPLPREVRGHLEDTVTRLGEGGADAEDLLVSRHGSGNQLA